MRQKLHLIHYADDFDLAASQIAVLRAGDVIDV